MIDRRYRRTLTWACAVLLCLSLVSCCCPRTSCCPTSPAGVDQEPPKFLFVQSAKSADIRDGRIRLHGVNPTTIFFSDRPRRIAGHVATDVFVEAWTAGPDSFADNPPNANLSVLDQDSVEQVIVVLTEPAYDAGSDTLSYNVKILSGEVPADGGVVSLFIDDAVAFDRHPIVHGHIEKHYPGGRKQKIHHGNIRHSDD